MRKLLALLILLPASMVFAQVGAIQGFCTQGGVPAKVQGLNSTNTMQGVVPSCLVTVHVSGTQTLATIYSDGSETPKNNPFYATALGLTNPGGWIFYSATNQAVDIYGSRGICPNCYSASTPLDVGVYPSSNLAPIAGVVSAQGTSPVEVDGASGAPVGGAITISCPTCSTSGGINQLTGDVTAGPGSGSQAATLATVNSSPGSYTSANITVNAKGLVTAAANGSGGGSGILPANANFAWLGTSIKFDDTHVLATAIPVTGWTTTTGVTTVTNSGTNHLVTGEWVDMWATTSWPVNGTYESGTGQRIFQVLSTGLSSTQFEIDTSGISAGTCSSTCGDAYSANAYIPYATATAVGMPTAAYANTYAWCAVDETAPNCTLYALSLHISDILTPLEPGTTGQPLYVIIDSPIDDLVNCYSTATIEGYYQTILEGIHTAGGVAVIASPTGTNTATVSGGPCAYYAHKNTIDQWLRQQGKTTVLTGSPASTAYWDIFSDWGHVMSNASDTNVVATNGGAGPTGASQVALTTAADLESGGGRPLSQLHETSYFGIGGNLSGSPSSARGWLQAPTSDGSAAFRWTNAAQTEDALAIDTSDGGLQVGFGYGPSTAYLNIGGHCSNDSELCVLGNGGGSNYAFWIGAYGDAQLGFSGGGGTLTAYESTIKFTSLASGSGENCLQTDDTGTITNTGSACGSGGGGLNGTVTYTSSQSASTSDAGKLVIMNCSGACAYTLPTSQPSTTWNAWVVSMGSTVATIALGGSDTFNGTTNVPVLNSFRVMPVWANSATSTDYRGDAPLVASTNVTLTPASNGLAISAAGGSSGLSGMTATQVPIAATATTVTSSMALAGSGSGITTGPTSSTNTDCAQFTGTGGQIADSGSPCGGSSGAITNITSAITPTNCTVSGGICTTAGAVASITLASIPGTYISLRLVMFGSGSNSTPADIHINFNSDSGSNYNYTTVWTSSSGGPTRGSGSAATSGVVCEIGANGSSYGGGGSVYIPFYTNTTFWKQARGVCSSDDSSSTYEAVIDYATSWHSITAITSITLTPNSGNFNTGDGFVLYAEN